MERFDYRTLTPENVRDAFDRALDDAERFLRLAVAAQSPRTFDSTLDPVSEACRTMWAAAGRGPLMSLVHPDETVREAAGELLGRFHAWMEGLPARHDLAGAILDYAASDDARMVEGERRRVLDLWVRDLRRAGHELDETTRSEVSSLRARMGELMIRFVRNVNEWTDAVELGTADLDGLAPTFVEQLPPGAAPGSRTLGITGSQVETFLAQSTRRDLRELVQRRWLTRAPSNLPALDEILQIRRGLARLLGYASWSDFANASRMSGSAAAVRQFLDGLTGPLEIMAQRERAAMRDLPGAPDGPIASWDWTFLTERRRASMADAQELDSYLPLDRVLEGLFDLVRDVFGVDVAEDPEPMGWDETVRLVVLQDVETGEPLADVYLDLFSRPGKSPTPFQAPLRLASYDGVGRRTRAVILLAANAVPPRPGAPTLLSRGDVEMLFHEFGHVLETATSQARTVAGNFWWGELDFVEAPSQIMEHWTWEPAVLRRFARHHETGEPPQDELLDAVCRTRGLSVAQRTLWIFVYRAVLDQLLHGADALDTEEAYREAFAVTGFPFPEGTFQPSSFSHAVLDYDAGFYSYLWAQVFGDDMFAVFRTHGILSAEVGRRYRREILEPSWTRTAADRLRGFLGREPSPAAFLQRLGLPAAAVAR